MASIEVSLSTSHRRKKSGPLFRTTVNKDGEVESVRKSIREKDEVIQNMKLIVPGLKLRESCNNVQPFTDKEKAQIDNALSTLKTEVDAKKLAIKNLKMALDRLDISDNIDVRIRQAELEFQLGREELNLLTLLEEARALQACLDEAERRCSSPDAHTLYRCMSNFNIPVQLIGVEVEFDSRNPKFGAGPKEKQAGLWVDWALQDSGIKEGDRLVEVNGKIVLDKTREDLQRLLSAAPDPAQIVLLRGQLEENKNNSMSSDSSEEITSLKSELDVVKERAEETQRVKDGLVADNIRLTHRISYLEEQVAELLSRQQKPDGNEIRHLAHKSVPASTKQNVTSININAPPGTVVSQNSSSAIQVFQKGHLTALVSLNEDRPKSSLSSSRMSTPTSNGHSHKAHRHRQYKNYNDESNPRSTYQNGFDTYKEQNEAAKSVLNLHSKDYRIRGRELKANCRNSQMNGSKLLDYEDNNSTINQNGYNNEENDSLNEKEIHWRDRRKSSNLQDKYENMKGSNHFDNSIVDESYRKATKIVEDLMNYKNNGHNIKACEKIERGTADILRHFNSRKSASMAEFLNQRNDKKYGQEFKSVEELDVLGYNHSTPTNGVIDSRSVKSLDFDSDCTSIKSTNNSTQKYTGYTSEPIDTNVRLRWGEKTRPTPPKKPIRLSLHKAQSLQFVDSQISIAGFDPRKPVKRNHRGETQAIEQEQTLTTTRTSYRINA